MDLTADSFKLDKGLITLEKSQPVSKAIKELSAARIYCAPIIGDDGKCIGLLDFNDIASFLAHTFMKKVDASDCAAFAKATFPAADLEGMHYRFSHATVEMVMNFSKGNPLNCVAPNTTLKEILKTMQGGCHRVPVCEDGKVTSLVTQSAVVRTMSQNRDAIKDILSKKVSEITHAKKSVITMTTECRAIDVFATMSEKKVSAVPILDAQGHFFSNVSAKDVSYALEDFSLLLKPIQQYVAALRQANLFTTNPSVHCLPSDTLETVFDKFLATKMHRIYVVDDVQKFHPVGVISLRDMLEACNQ